jgi:hypothetical protein
MCKNRFAGVEVNSQEHKEKRREKKENGKWVIFSLPVSSQHCRSGLYYSHMVLTINFSNPHIKLNASFSQYRTITITGFSRINFN